MDTRTQDNIAFEGVDIGEPSNVQGPPHTPITVHMNYATRFDEEMEELE